MRLDFPPDDPRHGTTNGYSNLKCRCQPCRDANAEHMRGYRRALHKRQVPDTAHGTTNGYTNYGCRCVPCAAAQADAHRAWYHGRSS